MVYIADSSLFILGKRLQGSVITVPSVVKELRDEKARTTMELMNVRVELPLESFIKKVKAKAKLTRDSEELSTTDIHVLAKALEYSQEGAILVTDDFAVQNIALLLGIEVMPVAQRRIKDILIWEKQCIACKRRFSSGAICPVCGSPLKKTRKVRVRTE